MTRITVAALAIWPLALGLPSVCVALATDGELHPLVDSFRFGTTSSQPTPANSSGRWSFTSFGSTGRLGGPASLRWGIVRDGSSLPTGLGEPSSPNDLIALLDDIHHNGASPGGDDLTQRDWFDLFASSVGRWDELSGLSFTYQTDDGARHSGASFGQANVRGDIRIGGHAIDGQMSPTVLAYNFFPSYGDMVVDTDERLRWGNPAGNFLRFRNMLMHELGHAVGLAHVESSSQQFLMGPFLATNFDGPQLDDILGIQRLYGDANEADGGNDTHQTATALGAIAGGQAKSVGTHADDTFVAAGETDFVSIDDNSDVDFFSFTIQHGAEVTVTLTPKGPTYDEAQQNGTPTPLASNALSDLSLSLIASDGAVPIAVSDSVGIGMAEVIAGAELNQAGTYFVRIGGRNDNIQLYQLDITVVPEPTTAALAACALLLLAQRGLLG